MDFVLNYINSKKPTRSKILFSHLIIVIVSISLVYVFFWNVSRNSLIERSFKQLDSVGILEKSKFQRYFHNIKSQIRMILEHESYFRKSSFTVEDGRRFEKTLQYSGFSQDILDVFFIGPDFSTIYSISKSKLPDELIQIIKKREIKKGFITELSHPYEKGQLSCFWLIEPVFHFQYRPVAYLILKFSNRALNEFLAERTGLGLTGESYVIGSDLLMRTESRFNLKYPMIVDTIPSRMAFEKDSGQVIATDYRKIRVLSSFHKLEIDGLNWRILSELDLAEVLRPLNRNFRNLIWIAGIVLSGAVLLSAWLSRAIFLEGAQKDEMLRKARQRILYEGQELERTRLSQELHDGIGQLLTAMSLRIASYSLEPPIKKQLKEALETIVVEIRRISNNLVPGVLINFGLVPALKNLCMQSSQYSPVQFSLAVDESFGQLSLSPEIERQLYRISQESVHNVIQHSHASECQLSMRKITDRVYLEIKDNGIGMTLDSILDKSPERNKGIASMRDRAESLDGEFQLFSRKGDGTKILVSIPWSKTNE